MDEPSPTPPADPTPGEVHVTAEALYRALERAAEYRRVRARARLRPRPAPVPADGDPVLPAAPAEPDPTGNLRERISWQRRAEPRSLGDGWFDVGTVFDELADPPAALAVWWQPATDAVRVQRPAPYAAVQDGPAPKLMAERNPFIR